VPRKAGGMNADWREQWDAECRLLWGVLYTDYLAEEAAIAAARACEASPAPRANPDKSL